MTLIDCLLLTLANVALCISFPKLLCLLLGAKDSQAKQSEPALKPQAEPALKPQVTESEIPIFI